MTRHQAIYAAAQRLINRFGPGAEDFAGAMLRCRLEADDLPGAGDWLAIGNAIEDLRAVPPPHRRH